jgi:acetyl-CoA synthetase
MPETCVTHPTYEERLAGFDWSIAERALGYVPGGPINIGWHCTDRICGLGLGRKPALIWEDFRGQEKSYTFDQLRALTNTFAEFLRRLGASPGERVCLFMDRVPELYIGFVGILKMGGIAQPLFSAFAEESLWTRLQDAGTSAIVTQRRHLAKVRRIRPRLPGMRHVIVIDAEGLSLQAGEVALMLEREPLVDQIELHLTTAETPSVLHYTSGTTGSQRGRSTSTIQSSRST